MLIRGSPCPIGITPPSSLDGIRRNAPGVTPFFTNLKAKIQATSDESDALKIIRLYQLEYSRIWLVKPDLIR